MSLYEIAELCGQVLSPHLYVEIFALDETHIMARFANKDEATSIWFRITL